MAGKNFLNPTVKILLCVFGTALIGYYVYESFTAGAPMDSTFIIRIMVLIGFIYLLIQSVRDLSGKNQ